MFEYEAYYMLFKFGHLNLFLVFFLACMILIHFITNKTCSISESSAGDSLIYKQGKLFFFFFFFFVSGFMHLF